MLRKKPAETLLLEFGLAWQEGRVTALFGGAAASLEPLNAPSLEEVWRRAPARCPSESPAEQARELTQGWGASPAQRRGY